MILIQIVVQVVGLELVQIVQVVVHRIAEFRIAGGTDLLIELRMMMIDYARIERLVQVAVVHHFGGWLVEFLEDLSN